MFTDRDLHLFLARTARMGGWHWPRSGKKIATPDDRAAAFVLVDYLNLLAAMVAFRRRILTRFADFLADGDKSLAFVMVLDLFFDWFLVAAAGELGVQLFRKSVCNALHVLTAAFVDDVSHFKLLATEVALRLVAREFFILDTNIITLGTIFSLDGFWFFAWLAGWDGQLFASVGGTSTFIWVYVDNRSLPLAHVTVVRRTCSLCALVPDVVDRELPCADRTQRRRLCAAETFGVFAIRIFLTFPDLRCRQRVGDANRLFTFALVQRLGGALGVALERSRDPRLLRHTVVLPASLHQAAAAPLLFGSGLARVHAAGFFVQTRTREIGFDQR